VITARLTPWAAVGRVVLVCDAADAPDAEQARRLAERFGVAVETFVVRLELDLRAAVADLRALPLAVPVVHVVSARRVEEAVRLGAEVAADHLVVVDDGDRPLPAPPGVAPAVPLTVIGRDGDDGWSGDRLARWRGLTTGPVRVRLVPGHEWTPMTIEAAVEAVATMTQCRPPV
jgi:hypothetical protein